MPEENDSTSTKRIRAVSQFSSCHNCPLVSELSESFHLAAMEINSFLLPCTFNLRAKGLALIK